VKPLKVETHVPILLIHYTAYIPFPLIFSRCIPICKLRNCSPPSPSPWFQPAKMYNDSIKLVPPAGTVFFLLHYFFRGSYRAWICKAIWDNGTLGTGSGGFTKRQRSIWFVSSVHPPCSGQSLNNALRLCKISYNRGSSSDFC